MRRNLFPLLTISKTIFFSLGWQVDILDDGREALMPPKMQDDNALSQLLRKRVMRAWTELYAWFLFHQSGRWRLYASPGASV